MSDLAAATLHQAATQLLRAMKDAGHDVDDVQDAAERIRAGSVDPRAAMPSWLTVQQAAELLTSDQRTIERWCGTGRLEASRQVRDGAARGAWRIEPASVARLISCRSERQKVPGQRRPAA